MAKDEHQIVEVYTKKKENWIHV